MDNFTFAVANGLPAVTIFYFENDKLYYAVPTQTR